MRAEVRVRLSRSQHVFGRLCDPDGEPCRAAIAAGVTEIAITDHVDHVPADPGYGYYRADEYLREVDRIRDQFSGELTVLRGGDRLQRGTTEHVERFVAEYGNEFDYVIGSVHYAADGAMIFPDYFAPRTMDDVFLPYLEQVQKAVETGWFDAIGHLDLPKRYAPKRIVTTIQLVTGAPGADFRRHDRARHRFSRSTRPVCGRRRKPACQDRRWSAGTRIEAVA